MSKRFKDAEKFSKRSNVRHKEQQAEDDKAYWDFVEKTAKEVRQWPRCMGGCGAPCDAPCTCLDSEDRQAKDFSKK